MLGRKKLLNLYEPMKTLIEFYTLGRINDYLKELGDEYLINGKLVSYVHFSSVGINPFDQIYDLYEPEIRETILSEYVF